MTKKLTKVAMTTALAAAAIVPAVVATPAQAAEAEVTFAKAYYSTANGTAAFEAGKLAGVISATTDTGITHLEASNGEVFTMQAFSAYLAVNPTATTDQVLTALSKAGKALSADQVKALNVKEGKVEGGKVTVDADAPVADVKVESVKATNKTTVEVVLSEKVDTVTAANFAIEGGNVTAASLADDKKTVTLAVSGLAYDTDYTVVVSNVLVGGETKDFGSKSFKSPAVTDLWELQIKTSEDSLVADGSDNLEVTFNLISKETGAIDKDADNIVLDLNTTYGTLAQKRVTVQDGTATVLLTSEFSNVNINAKVDAQIIEASGDYKELIGKVVASLNVPFVTSATENVDTLTLVSAEANQADRVTLFFDKEVSLKHFVKTNAKGELLYLVGSTEYTADEIPANTPASQISHVFKVAGKTVELAQGSKTNFKVQGFKPVAGNSKAVEVILDKTTVLKDNADVKVDVVAVNSIGKETNSSADFKVTDARKPEATAVNVEGLNTLKVKFSEAIADATFKIDGRFNSPDAFTYSFGDFNPVTLVDNRDLATIKLVKGAGGTGSSAGYDEDGIVDTNTDNTTLSGYFTAGNHTLQISSTKDFAFATDPNNLGTTQNLGFKIAADSTKPNATVTVESPEQFRLKFDKSLSLPTAAALQTLITNGDIQLQFLDTDGEYKNVDGRTAGKGKVDKTNDYHVEQVSASEYVIELKQDWTNIYDTNSENKNYYNDKFRLFIKKNAVTSVTNGLKNDEIKLDLNYAGSPLNSADTLSPVINTIDRVTTGSSNFHVTMSEPVKLNGHVTAETPTLAQGQASLQDTTVQFLGKDKNGAAVTINGQVIGYADKNHADKMLNVSWAFQADGTTPNTVTPQTVVDAGGSEDWTIVIRSISDDVGNTAASATKEFKVKKSAATDTPFFVKKYVAPNAKAGKHMVEGFSEVSPTDNRDKIEITFSEGVQYSGLSDATNPANYTLNGVTLPAGTSIAVADADTNTANGFEIVEITLPDGTINLGANVSNVITVNKNLVSYDGSKIQGPTEVIVNVDENNNAAAAQPVIDAITALDNTASTFAADVAAARAAYDALTPAQQALVTNAPALVAAEGEVADVAAAQTVITKITNATSQTEIETARTDYTALTPAQKALVTNEGALQTKEQGLVDGVTLIVSATYTATSNVGDTVVVDAQTGFTYAITGSDATSVINNNGEVVAAGTAILTYTVTHTASGKTATKTVSVTVAS